MIVVGLSSGTSRDGIDVAVVEFGAPGADLQARLRYRTTLPYPAELADRLERAALSAGTTWVEVCRLDAQIGQAFARAAQHAVEAAGRVDAVCSHGQTLHHWVEDGRARGTLQLGNPAWIAEAVGVPVVADVRSRDLAAGGQGAPLVPVLDQLLLAGLEGRPAALNLGGIANVTVPHRALAYDTGPANSLLDAAVRIRAAHPAGYDPDGVIAATGEVHKDLLDALLALPYFAAEPPKSTGPELFGPELVREVLSRVGDVPTADLLATLTLLTARTVAAEVRRWEVTRVVASGGGTRNGHLMALLREELGGIPVGLSDELGLPSAAKEAFAFALIGWLTLNGLPGNVPSCTGAAGPRVLGVVTGDVAGTRAWARPAADLAPPQPRRLTVLADGQDPTPVSHPR